MAGWLDGWARRAAQADPPASAARRDDSSVPTGSSRREFLKKAGVVGGVAWSVPVMQTVMAPAASASGAVIGNPCSPAGVACGDGSICFNGVCGAPGASCAGGRPCFNSDCSSNVCGGFNASCAGGLLCAPTTTCNNAGNPKCK